MRRILTLAAGLSLGVSGLAFQQVDVSTLGPQVGATAPPLRLVDHRGRTQTIQSAAGPNGTLVVFFRSADW